MAQMTSSPDASTNETNDAETSVSTPHHNNQWQYPSNVRMMNMNEPPNQATSSPTLEPPIDFPSPSLRPTTPTPAPPHPPPPTCCETTNAEINRLLSGLLQHVLQSNPHLLPPFPHTTKYLTSKHINDIAHAMWNVAFTHGDLLQRACQYGAMFSPLKLAALAKLNFLPSWWFFRDLAVKGLKHMGWNVVDNEMEETWEEALEWCIEVSRRKGEGSKKEENQGR
ncbi:hypothetical protein J3E74DRAFT_404328 [Bipolaris maydis]|nr:hypothetical protein J3E74DRAFT_404328 [Bipolaris maydis]